MTESISAHAQRVRQPTSGEGNGISNKERQELQAAYTNLEPGDRAQALRDLRAAQDPIADDLAALDRLLSFGAEDISKLVGTVSRAMTGGDS